MKNVTISMKEDVARWARIEAARLGTSVSKMIGEMIERLMNEREAYESAMSQYLNRERRPLKQSGSYPNREQLYDRDEYRNEVDHDS